MLSTAAFSQASAVRPDGDGRYLGELHPDWSVGGRPHGGYLLAIAARAAIEAADRATPDVVAVSAQYLRPPGLATVSVRTEQIKTGRTVGVLRVVLEQDGLACLEATVNVGTLPAEPPQWAEPPTHPSEPVPGAIEAAELPGNPAVRLNRSCEVWLDPDGAAFLTGATGPPRLRLWARPRGEPPDPLFALVAGDISMPTAFNLGRFGWTPTVQLTALVRARPVPGWLTVVVDTRSVHGNWFDEDATVLDASGQIVCQARQLALLPRR